MYYNQLFKIIFKKYFTFHTTISKIFASIQIEEQL